MDTESTGALPENNETYQAETGGQDDLKNELLSVKQQNQELMEKFNQLLAAQQKQVEQPKKLSAEEIKELMDKNPEQAIQYALKNTVESQVRQIEQNLTAKQQMQYWDQKVSQDFPLFEKDPKFKEIVKTEMRKLVDDGMSKDTPKLVYRAAEIAALKYKGSSDSEGKGGTTSEAPTSVKRTGNSKGLPSNFDVMAKMFGLNDKAKERAKAAIQERSELAERRRQRGY